MSYKCSKCGKRLKPKRYYHTTQEINGVVDFALECPVHGEVYIEAKYHTRMVCSKTNNLDLYVKCEKLDLIKKFLLRVEAELDTNITIRNCSGHNIYHYN